MRHEIETFRDGMFLAPSRTYGETYMEPIIRKFKGLSESSTGENDAENDNGEAEEIKCSKVLLTKTKTNSLVERIILESENLEYNKVLGKNPFSLMINLFGHLSDQVEKGDIAIGRLAAKHRNVKLNLYFTPTKLTENSLIFNKQLMETWWQQGYHYAESKHAIGQPMDKSEKFKDETENV